MKKILLAFVCSMFISFSATSQIRINQRLDGSTYIVVHDATLKEILTYIFTTYYKREIKIIPSEVFENSYYLIHGFENLDKDIEFCSQPILGIEYKIENGVIIFSERKKKKGS